ncbi:MAG TPA: hypothetical protein PKZ92_01775 [Candidatus Woesebacteria bacterium]|jgi:uncharacterized oligopeptide transporter (OPT) family protein|nr:hypothetical protein [Candidatus Shapirobacteria bacterium]HOG37658.1 hypothetical protein [Candidatus Woesebacteria bacterium]HOR01965.1 hypothetical protein [Candidatus Woesebacteria bacterium]
MVLTKPLIADTTYKLEGPGLKPDLSNPAKPLEGFLSQIIGILTIVAVIYFIIQVIFAGYSFISAQGNKDKIEAARSRLTNGILGLTIIVVALGVGAFIASLLGIKDPLSIQNIMPKNQP